MSWQTLQIRARQAGRTTRMIERALQLDAAGKAVYILCHNLESARALRFRFKLPDSIKTESWDTLLGVDLQHMRPSRSAHPNCVLLIDHAAIEDRFRSLLEELHRYD